MSENTLIPVSPKKSLLPFFNTAPLSIAQVQYEKIDASHYSFTFDMDESVHVRMDESDQESGRSQFVDADFETAIPESERVYYTIAAACGTAMGAFSLLPFTGKALEKIEEWSEKDWHKYIVLISQLIGYKKNDYRGAVQFLVNRTITYAEQIEPEASRGFIKEKLLELSSNPSWAGLMFSVFSQFSGKSYSFDEKNGLRIKPLAKYYAVGQTLSEKLLFGFLYWVFYLSADVVLSKRQLVDEIGLPKELLRVIKEFVNLPLMKTIPSNYEEAEKQFSTWLVNTFSNYAENDESHSIICNILRIINEKEDSLKEQSFPVMLNECLVRGLYVIRKLHHYLQEKNVSSFSDLQEIIDNEIIPFNNKLISRMMLVSSASFVAANVSGATLKVLAKKKVGKRAFAKALLTEINVVGVGRFIISCVEDSKYWRDDVRVSFEKVFRAKSGNHAEANVIIEESDESDFDAFEILTLDAIQARVLYSLENHYILHDIKHTKKERDKETKSQWLSIWKSKILLGTGMHEDYFITDENLLYSGLNELFADKGSWRDFYLLATEMALFKPYHPLGTENDREFKKLKPVYNYVSDEFIRRQTIITQAQIDTIQKKYEHYKGSVSGSTRNRIIGISAATVVTVATGGLAWAFAPQIAIAIAGEAVLGLHGAALSGASLAFVGGGSLAAGGFGIAGGTAIITGGGALLGLASSGTASVAAVLSQTSEEYWIRQGAKLLTFCSAILNERMDEQSAVRKLYAQISQTAEQMEQTFAEIKEEKNDLDDGLLKRMKEYLSCITRCEKELQRLVEKPD